MHRIAQYASKWRVKHFQFAEIAISPDIAHLCGSQGFPGINGEIRQNLNFNHSLRIRIQIVLNSVFEIIIMFISHRLNIKISFCIDNISCSCNHQATNEFITQSKKKKTFVYFGTRAARNPSLFSEHDGCLKFAMLYTLL